MDINQPTNLMNASDEEIARLNKILAKQLLTKTVFTVIGGITVAVVGQLIKNALETTDNDNIDTLED